MVRRKQVAGIQLGLVGCFGRPLSELKAELVQVMLI